MDKCGSTENQSVRRGAKVGVRKDFIESLVWLNEAMSTNAATQSRFCAEFIERRFQTTWGVGGRGAAMVKFRIPYPFI